MPSETPRRAPGGLSVVALLLLAIVPYLPGLFYGFVYDDHGALKENAFLAAPDAWARVLTLQTVRDPVVLDGQRPALLASVLLDRAWGAREAWHFRLTNLALHAGCTLLLFGWLRGVLRRHGDPSARGRALVAAALFAIHPLGLEAVQLPSYREDTLSLFWMCVALAAMPIRRTLVRAPLQVLALLFALGAKESAAVLPVLIGWICWCFPRERPATKGGAIGYALLPLVALGWLAWLFAARAPQALGSEVWNGLSLRGAETVWTAPWLFAHYAKLLVAPWPLCADRIVAPVSGAFDPRFLAGVIVTLATPGLAFFLRARQPLAALGLGWLLIAFAPVSNLIPLHNPMADRYAYALIAGFALLPAAMPMGDRVVRRGLAALVVTFLLLHQLRLPDWRSDGALWASTFKVEPHSARAHVGLGLDALADGADDIAAQLLARADELNPQDVTALVNLAVMDGRRGDTGAAITRLQAAVTRRPDKAEAWANLAVALELAGRREEALHAAEQARRRDPLGRF